MRKERLKCKGGSGGFDFFRCIGVKTEQVEKRERKRPRKGDWHLEEAPDGCRNTHPVYG